MTSPPSTAVHPTMIQSVKKHAVLSAMLVAILCVPFVVFAVLSGEPGASSWALLAGFTGLVNLATGGRAIGYLSVALLTALVPVAIVSGAVPLAGAGLMAIMCFGVGVSAARGLNKGMLLIPLYLAFLMIAPPTWDGAAADRNSTTYLVWTMVIWGGGGLWALLVFPPLLRRMGPPDPEPNSRADTTVYTIIITVLCTLSTLVVLAWKLGFYGAWIVLAVLAVTQVGHEGTVKHALAWVGGTLVGTIIAAVIAVLTSSEVVVVGLGLVLLFAAIVIKFGPYYWLYVAFITPTIVLLSSASSADVAVTDTARVTYALLGAALVVLSSAIAVGWARYQETAAGTAGTPAAT